MLQHNIIILILREWHSLLTIYIYIGQTIDFKNIFDQNEFNHRANLEFHQHPINTTPHPT